MLITAVGEQYASADQSDFMMNVLKHGVEITPNSMMEILSKYA
jgi:hypothetical protein